MLSAYQHEERWQHRSRCLIAVERKRENIGEKQQIGQVDDEKQSKRQQSSGVHHSWDLHARKNHLQQSVNNLHNKYS